MEIIKTSLEGKKFKVLVHGNVFVDENKLHQGIYTTLIPNLHSDTTTIESMCSSFRGWATDIAFKIVSEALRESVISRYKENISNCQLVEVSLTIKD